MLVVRVDEWAHSLSLAPMSLAMTGSMGSARCFQGRLYRCLKWPVTAVLDQTSSSSIMCWRARLLSRPRLLPQKYTASPSAVSRVAPRDDEGRRIYSPTLAPHFRASGISNSPRVQLRGSSWSHCLSWSLVGALTVIVYVCSGGVVALVWTWVWVESVGGSGHARAHFELFRFVGSPDYPGHHRPRYRGPAADTPHAPDLAAPLHSQIQTTWCPDGVPMAAAGAP